MEKNKSQKIPTIFECKKCNYNTSSRKDYNKHLLTAKHQKEMNGNEWHSKIPTCEYCEKTFKTASGLWKHKRNCYQAQEYQEEPIETNPPPPIMPDMSVFIDILKQNQEFKELMVEQSKQNQELQKQLIEATKASGSHIENQTNNNNTTNNNQKFNLNFFLNDTCKDAMNMSDFIKNMDINFEDIENIGKNGYVTGMTDMILSRIKNLDVIKRPMHCTDLKRETMYIKDNNEWEKDTPDNKKLHKMMSIISKRNYSTIPLWRDEHPECQNMQHPHCDFSVDMLRNVLGDVGEGQIKLDNKVIKNISKHIIVDK
jgi:hypothetical protein